MEDATLASTKQILLNALGGFQGSAEAVDHIAAAVLSLTKTETEELKQRLILKKLVQ